MRAREPKSASGRKKCCCNGWVAISATSPRLFKKSTAAVKYQLELRQVHANDPESLDTAHSGDGRPVATLGQGG
jgi:hypothetical protein